MATSGPNLFNQLFNRQTNSRADHFPSNVFRERLKLAKNLYKTDLIGHYGCVNAIEFSNGGKYLVSGGDDKRVLLWDVEKSISGYEKPISMDKEHQSNIFCLGFDKTNSKIFSGGNDELVIVHDFETQKVIDVFIHQKPVYGLSVDPTCDSILATACEDGKITIYDQRKSAAVQIFGKFGGSRQASFHAVQFHPYDGNYLVTANTRKGAAFWDIRSSSKPLIQYGGEENQPSCMSVRFNSNGTLVLALRRRLPPILYNTSSEIPICQFYHSDYYNSCTMKSCCFAGEDDEYVLSGSDDFNLYVWRVGDVDLEQNRQWIENTQMVLNGHRSIVNQVRYNKEKCILASSGVEKVVKLWSPFDQKDWSGSLIDETMSAENPREVFTHDAYVSLVNTTMSHDYSTQNTQEDSRMMAFFDSLIQQEIEGWNTTTYSSDSYQFRSESSEEQSTRHNSSTDDSDEEQNINYFVNSRDRNRRGSLATIKPQRNKYTNRIAYLIATKRNTLRRLALKGASNSRRRQSSLKTKRKLPSSHHHHHHRSTGSHQITRTSRSGNSQKRIGRYMPSVSYRNRTNSNNHNPDMELKNVRHKRYDAVFRALRRKHRSRRHIDPSDTSSDDDDDLNLKFSFDTNRTSNLAVPSTSTGITSSGRDIIIRLRQQEQLLDSEFYDDDDDEETPNAASTNQNATDNNNIINNNVTNNVNNNINNNISNNITINNNNNINNVNNQPTTRHILNGRINNIISYRNSPIQTSSNDDSDSEHRQNNSHENNNNNNVNSNNNNNNNNISLVSTSANESIQSNLDRISRKRHIQIHPIASSSSSTNNLATTNNINNNRNLDIYSSHSNSRLSNSDDYLEDDNSFSNESLDCFISNKNNNGKKLKISADNSSQNHNNNLDGNKSDSSCASNIIINNNINNNNDIRNNKIHNKNTNSCNSNNNSIEVKTPKNNKFKNFSNNFTPITPDSGIPGSSTSSSSRSASRSNTIDSSSVLHNGSSSSCNNNNNTKLNSDKFSIKLFHQKIARVRRNYRNKFADDSDSD